LRGQLTTGRGLGRHVKRYVDSRRDDFGGVLVQVELEVSGMAMRPNAARTAAMLTQHAPMGNAEQATKGAPNLEPRYSFSGPRGWQAQGET
jgi:hypothetical protein